MSLELIVLLAIGSLAAVFALPVLRYLEARPDWVLWLIGILYLGNVLSGEDVTFGIHLGPISVYPMDLVAPLLLLLAFPVIYQKLKDGFGTFDVALLLLLGWGIMLAVSYLTGLRTFGIQDATNEFRSYLYVFTTALFFATRRPAEVWNAVERLWLLFAVVFTVYSFIGYTDGDFSRAGRPIAATPTLILLQATLILIFKYQRGAASPWVLPACAVFFPLIILLQHRSVWAVMLFSVGVASVLSATLRAYVLKWGTVGVIVFASAAGLLFGNVVFQTLKESYQEAVAPPEGAGRSTLMWRIETWTALLTGDQMQTPRQKIIGNPFGKGWDRVVTTSSGAEELRTESPHNFYIQTMLRTGLVGVVLFILLHFKVLQGLFAARRRFPADEAVFTVMVVLILGQMLFYLPYGSHFIQAVLLGIGVSGCREMEAARARDSQFEKSGHWVGQAGPQSG